MESLGIIGFVFGLAALAKVVNLTKEVENLKSELESQKISIAELKDN
jgi:hypothetical protein